MLARQSAVGGGRVLPFTAARVAPGPARRAPIRRIASRKNAATSDSSSSSSRRAALAVLLAPAAAAGLAQLGAALPAIADEAAAEPVAAAAPAAATSAGFRELYDATLAYRFSYPTTTASGTQLTMTLTRPPEKYSSAAPLSADARQRIVAELFDLSKFVTASVTVGPASGVLKELPQEEWRPRDVALTVLIDRSTARLSSGQRTALNDVEEVHAEQRDGQTYWVYEHTSQGSPTISSARAETYRHALAVSTTRPGLDGRPYIYTLNMSCPQALWDDMAGPFKAAVDSFKLVATTNAYIPPDKDPWLFF